MVIAMKEIVIKISDEFYEKLMDRTKYIHDHTILTLGDAVRNGKVLPKGHGRLIDADKYVKSICNSCDGSCDFVGCDCLNCHEDCRCEFAKELDDADVLVEADKGDNDDKRD